MTRKSSSICHQTRSLLNFVDLRQDIMVPESWFLLTCHAYLQPVIIHKIMRRKIFLRFKLITTMVLLFEKEQGSLARSATRQVAKRGALVAPPQPAPKRQSSALGRPQDAMRRSDYESVNVAAKHLSSRTIHDMRRRKPDFRTNRNASCSATQTRVLTSMPR